MIDASVEQLSAADYQGYLKKWTNYVSKYQYRWVVLKDGMLSYYLDRSMVGSIKRSEICLAACTVVGHNNFCFDLVREGKILMSFQASERNQYDAWLIMLRRGVASFKGFGAAVDSTYSFGTNSTGSLTTDLRINQVHQASVVMKSCCSQVVKYSFEITNTMKNLLRNLDVPQNTACQEQLAKLEWMLTALSELKNKAEKSIEELVQASDLMIESTAASRASVAQSIMESKPSASTASDNNSQRKSNISEEEDGLFKDAIDFSDSLLSVENKELSTTLVASADLAERSIVMDVNGWRSSIPPRPPSPSGVTILIRLLTSGKELFRGSLPVEYNEPLSMLQRVAESLEYSYLLDRAGECTDDHLQLCYVCAFVISNYCNSEHRLSKPFNPLLGETFELDRMEDLGFRSFSEQVSHHPPICATHSEGKNWVLEETYDVESKFRLPRLYIYQKGHFSLTFRNSGKNYTWDREKVVTTINNIISTKPVYIRHNGPISVYSLSTGDFADLRLGSDSYWSSSDSYSVTGEVKDQQKTVHYTLSGEWNDNLKCFPCNHPTETIPQSIDCSDKNSQSITLWQAHKLPESASEMYHFSPFTCCLNQSISGVAPTDSRLRPDQRLLENRKIDEAEISKKKLEEAQRTRAKEAIQKALCDGIITNEKVEYETFYKPNWFEKQKTKDGKPFYKYARDYWTAKKEKNFGNCAELFNV